MPVKSIVFGTTKNAVVTDAGLLLLRLFSGLALALAHGFGKIPPSPRFVAGVEAMGFPAPLFFAWAAGVAESAGGLLLVLGLATRPAAFFIACTMASAGFLRHAGDPFSGQEKAFLFGVVALLFLLAGAGRYSIDALIRK